MIVKNPTTSELAVQIDGIKYVVPAEDQLKEVPTEHAEHWKRYIHGFIELVDEAKVSKPEPKVPEVILTPDVKEKTSPKKK